MWIRRKYLNGVDLSCQVGKMDQHTLVVQDFNTTIQRIVARAQSGVINPDTLRNAGMSYSDFGLPVNMSVFDRIDLARANAARLQSLQAQQPGDPVVTPGSVVPDSPDINQA